MGRWIWELHSKQNQFWVRVINSKYGGWPALQNGWVHCWDSHWWRDLRKLYQHNDFNIIHQNLVWKAGCGDKIRFWKDNWLGEGCSLDHKYPQLFTISKQQNELISTMGSFHQNIWRWNLKWRRHLFEHEEGVAVAFMDEISAYPIQCHLKDTVLWKAEPTGLYSTRSAYRLLSNQNSSASDGRNFQIIWSLKIPPKAAIFTWRLIKDRLPTRVNLQRRNVGLQESFCPLCLRSRRRQAIFSYFGTAIACLMLPLKNLRERDFVNVILS